MGGTACPATVPKPWCDLRQALHPRLHTPVLSSPIQSYYCYWSTWPSLWCRHALDCYFIAGFTKTNWLFGTPLRVSLMLAPVTHLRHSGLSVHSTRRQPRSWAALVDPSRYTYQKALVECSESARPQPRQRSNGHLSFYIETGVQSFLFVVSVVFSTVTHLLLGLFVLDQIPG